MLNREIDALQYRLEHERTKEDIIICAIEEMSEATKVLTKYLRGSHKFSKENLTEEVAHALLLLDTIKNVFELDHEQLEREKLHALRKCFGLDS